MADLATASGTFHPSAPRIGVVRGISYGLFGKPDEFMPPVRALGAGFVRAYIYWGQVEPQPGWFVWDTVDALLGQLDAGDEVWITVCSSSPWATRQPTDFLPPSPAHDIEAYAAFVRGLVDHCAGRVQFWQCDNEPSNTGLLWAGTAPEYVTQLKALYAAVKDVDPTADVVLGGCGYDVFASDEGSEQRAFFDHLVSAGKDAFDVFSVNLYGEPTRVPEFVATARAMMRANGYLKPIVAGEHGGPVLFEFPEVEGILQQVLAQAFAEPPATQSTDELVARAAQETPERKAMAALYAQMPELPPKLQMFMDGCTPELEAKRHRINCRQLVMRTVLALSAGVLRTAYWSLGPEVPAATDPYQIMHLLFGKLPLLDYADGFLSRPHPAAHTFTLLAEQLAGVETVTRVDVRDRSELYAFRIDRRDRGPVLVLWDQRDTFDGEDEAPVTVRWPWHGSTATVIDVFGDSRPAEVRDGQLRIPVSITPVFVHG